VQRIPDEAGGDEGMLPLLQYALKESWALRKGNSITGDSYARSGGVREAFSGNDIYSYVSAHGGTSPSLGATVNTAARTITFGGAYNAQLYGFNNGSDSESFQTAEDSESSYVSADMHPRLWTPLIRGRP